MVSSSHLQELKGENNSHSFILVPHVIPIPITGTQVRSSQLLDPLLAVAQQMPQLVVEVRVLTLRAFLLLWSVQVQVDLAMPWPPPHLLTPPHAPPDEEGPLLLTSHQHHE